MVNAIAEEPDPTWNGTHFLRQQYVAVMRES